MQIVVVCRKCGFERLVPREEIVSGQWRRRCPVCKATDVDNERVPDTAA